MLTKSDLNAIGKMLDARIELKFDEKLKNLATKDDIAHLPTKDEFYNRMDKWMKQVADKASEKAAHSLRHTRTDERLDRIEKHIGISTY